MYKSNDHNSWMMLGLLGILHNKGVITAKERADTLDLGEFIEENHDISKAKELIKKLEELSDKQV